MTAEEILASRFLGARHELLLFLGAALLGALLGGAYDILRALRLTFRHLSPLVFFEDAAFTVLFGLAFYTFCTGLTLGQLRFFVLLAMAAGFFAYLSTLGRLAVRAVSFVVNSAKRLLKRLGELLKKTAKLLCGVPFFKGEEEKMSEKPCTDRDV